MEKGRQKAVILLGVLILGLGAYLILRGQKEPERGAPNEQVALEKIEPASPSQEPAPHETVKAHDQAIALKESPEAVAPTESSKAVAQAPGTEKPSASQEKPEDAPKALVLTQTPSQAPSQAQVQSQPGNSKPGFFSRLFGLDRKPASVDPSAVQPKASLDAKDTDLRSEGKPVEVLTPAEPVALQSDSGCFLLTYRPQDGKKRDLANSRNFLALKDLYEQKPSPKLHPKATCVRVDGTPVRYDWVEGKEKRIKGLMLGPITSAKSTVTVRYCLQDTKCKISSQECDIPKDEFLGAIGGEDSEIRTVKWNPNDSDRDQRAAEELDDVVKRELAAIDRKVFDGWKSEIEPSSCKQAMAQTKTNP
jgi:hypothetical protein